MKKTVVLACMFLAVCSTSSFAGLPTTSNYDVVVNPGEDHVRGGTVIDVQPDGTIVIVDQETGTIRIVSGNGLNVNVLIGDTINFILITTPNGNEIVKIIKHP